MHCPHGFSDKEYYLKKCAYEDIVLVYGDNMLDMLRECDIPRQNENYVICGNYRYTYYKHHKDFYRDITQQEILSKFAKQQTTILYAPTWNDTEKASSFFDAADTILGKLPSDYNIIVKLHPNLEEDNLAEVFQIQARYEDKPNILFLSQFPLVYPLLEFTDIYLGDISSLGYDFLVYNRPMFFLDQPSYQSSPRQKYLQRCGVPIKPEQYNDLYSIIEANLPHDQERFANKRNEVYQYTFGKEKSFEQIRKEIIEACEKPYSESQPA